MVFLLVNIMGCPCDMNSSAVYKPKPVIYAGLVGNYGVGSNLDMYFDMNIAFMTCVAYFLTLSEE